MKKFAIFALFVPTLAGSSAMSQVVNPSNNPLIGTWISINKGYGACDAKRTFSPGTQTWYTNGQVVNAPATYAVDGKTIYVQQRPGAGGTVAFIMVGPDEMMDNLGTNACHWRRQ